MRRELDKTWDRFEVVDAPPRRSPFNARSQNRHAAQASEKDQELGGDRLMSVLGFTRWALSQARATRQTNGWPDRLYTHPAKGLAVYWEAKREGGKQRPAQKVFQAEIEACGMTYVCGPLDVLVAWCEARGLVKVLASGGYEVQRSAVPR